MPSVKTPEAAYKVALVRHTAYIVLPPDVGLVSAGYSALSSSSSPAPNFTSTFPLLPPPFALPQRPKYIYSVLVPHRTAPHRTALHPTISTEEVHIVATPSDNNLSDNTFSSPLFAPLSFFTPPVSGRIHLKLLFQGQWPLIIASCSVTASAWDTFPAHRHLNEYSTEHPRRPLHVLNTFSDPSLRRGASHLSTSRTTTTPSSSVVSSLCLSITTVPLLRGLLAAVTPPRPRPTQPRIRTHTSHLPYLLAEEEECLSSRVPLLLLPRHMRRLLPPSPSILTRQQLICRLPSPPRSLRR